MSVALIRLGVDEVLAARWTGLVLLESLVHGCAWNRWRVIDVNRDAR